MKARVFLKSTLRQPLRSLLVWIIVGLAAFMLVSRSSEYLLIRQETQRLESSYRAIGKLDFASGSSVDVGAAADYIDNSPYLLRADRPRYSSALMESLYNADVASYYNNNNVVFCGTLENFIKHEASMKGRIVMRTASYQLSIRVDAVLLGYPEYLWEGRMVYVYVTEPFEEPLFYSTIFSGNFGAIDNELSEDAGSDYGLFIVTEDAMDAFADMEIGKRYIFRGEPKDHFLPALKPSSFDPRPLVNNADSPWFIELAEGETIDLDDPRLAGLEEELALIRDNQHAIQLLTTVDMSGMPQTQEQSRSMFLSDGRWIDYEDHVNGNPVCLVHYNFAQIRELSVGDSITMTMRDLDNPYYAGYLMDRSDLARAGMHETRELTLEIVGIYNILRDQDIYVRSSEFNTVYIPDSVLPGTFSKDGGLGTETYHFELTSPAYKDRFVLETKDALSEFGVQAVFVNNGWDIFIAAVVPMRQSSLYNAVIYAGISLIVLCVAVFVYMRSRRKDFAVARALGTPRAKCIVRVSLPLTLFGAISMLAGGGLAWRSATRNAAETLGELAAIGAGDVGAVTLPLSWVLLLCLPLFLALLILMLSSAFFLSRQPVLRILQGSNAAQGATAKRVSSQTRQAKPKAQQALEGSALKNSATVTEKSLPDATSLPVKVRRAGAAQCMRFVRRQVLRNAFRSFLTLFLAAILLAGLAAIQLAIVGSEQELESLYQNTIVQLELIRANSTHYMASTGGGFVSKLTIDSILKTGYIGDYYIEGAATTYGVQLVDVENEKYFRRTTKYGLDLRGIVDIDGFYQYSGEEVVIEYINGWDEDMFDPAIAQATNSKNPKYVPVVIPRHLYEGYVEYMEKHDIQGEMYIVVEVWDDMPRMYLWEHPVGGIYDGVVSGPSYSATPILIPDVTLREITRGNTAYIKAVFEIDPARNKELAEFRDDFMPRLSGNTRISALLKDEELRQAVEPLENTIRLLNILYPIALAVAVLVAAGVSVLFILLSAKEAALLRVLGTSKGRSRLMLSLQMVLPCALGLALGLLGACLYMLYDKTAETSRILSMALQCGALYLLSSTVGSVICAVLVTNRRPLDLLQVKE